MLSRTRSDQPARACRLHGGPRIIGVKPRRARLFIAIGAVPIATLRNPPAGAQVITSQASRPPRPLV